MQKQKVQIIAATFLLVLIGVLLLVTLFPKGLLGATTTPTRVIKVVAKQYTYVPDTILLHYGEWVKLRLTTADVAHSFTLPSYGINQIISPGQETDITIHATKKGVFPFFCDIYCGPAEGNMTGKVVVQ